MFGIGFGELLVLVLIGIVILGPERCIKSAKALGRAWGKLQREWRGIKKDVSVDDDIRDITKDITDDDKKSDDEKRAR